jgi:hypothetical protein
MVCVPLCPLAHLPQAVDEVRHLLQQPRLALAPRAARELERRDGAGEERRQLALRQAEALLGLGGSGVCQ